MNYSKPVIALTAHAMVEERRRTAAAGFADHVTKPVDPAILAAAILKFT
jgi:CheY-like chemotaxis protein